MVTNTLAELKKALIESGYPAEIAEEIIKMYA
jgi:hypothetical protein